MKTSALYIDKEDVLCSEYIIHYLAITLYLYPHLPYLTINPLFYTFEWRPLYKMHVSGWVYGATLVG